MPTRLIVVSVVVVDATALSNFEASRDGSYDSKSASAQYDSKVVANFSTIVGASVCERRTFHSRPSTIAVVDKLDDPMKTVENPESRCSNHAFACNRVLSVWYETFTSAPRDTSWSIARRSVDPVYVLVITRSFPPRSMNS